MQSSPPLPSPPAASVAAAIGTLSPRTAKRTGLSGLSNKKPPILREEQLTDAPPASRILKSPRGGKQSPSATGAKKLRKAMALGSIARAFAKKATPREGPSISSFDSDDEDEIASKRSGTTPGQSPMPLQSSPEPDGEEDTRNDAPVSALVILTAESIPVPSSMRPSGELEREIQARDNALLRTTKSFGNMFRTPRNASKWLASDASEEESRRSARGAPPNEAKQQSLSPSINASSNALPSPRTRKILHSASTSSSSLGAPLFPVEPVAATSSAALPPSCLLHSSSTRGLLAVAQPQQRFTLDHLTAMVQSQEALGVLVEHMATTPAPPSPIRSASTSSLSASLATAPQSHQTSWLELHPFHAPPPPPVLPNDSILELHGILGTSSSAIETDEKDEDYFAYSQNEFVPEEDDLGVGDTTTATAVAASTIAPPLQFPQRVQSVLSPSVSSSSLMLGPGGTTNIGASSARGPSHLQPSISSTALRFNGAPWSEELFTAGEFALYLDLGLVQYLRRCKELGEAPMKAVIEAVLHTVEQRSTASTTIPDDDSSIPPAPLGHLSLKHYGLNEIHLTCLATLITHNTTLTSLDLRACNFAWTGVQVLSEAILRGRSNSQSDPIPSDVPSEQVISQGNTSLKVLDLSQNKLDTGMVNVPSSISLATTAGGGAAVDDEDSSSSSIAQSLLSPFGCMLSLNTTLHTLHLSQCRMSDRRLEEFILALSDDFHRSRSGIIDLRLDHNSISDRGASLISKMLGGNSSLTRLDLQHNCIRDQGGIALAQACEGHSSLVSLKLSHNGLGTKAGLAWAKAVGGKHFALQSLDLQQNQLQGTEMWKRLMAALISNQKHTKFKLLSAEASKHASRMSSPRSIVGGGTTMTRTQSSTVLPLSPSSSGSGVTSPASTILEHQGLQHINLSGNRLAAADAHLVAEAQRVLAEIAAHRSPGEAGSGGTDDGTAGASSVLDSLRLYAVPSLQGAVPNARFASPPPSYRVLRRKEGEKDDSEDTADSTAIKEGSLYSSRKAARQAAARALVQGGEKAKIALKSLSRSNAQRSSTKPVIKSLKPYAFKKPPTTGPQAQTISGSSSIPILSSSRALKLPKAQRMLAVVNSQQAREAKAGSHTERFTFSEKHVTLQLRGAHTERSHAGGVEEDHHDVTEHDILREQEMELSIDPLDAEHGRTAKAEQELLKFPLLQQRLQTDTTNAHAASAPNISLSIPAAPTSPMLSSIGATPIDVASVAQTTNITPRPTILPVSSATQMMQAPIDSTDVPVFSAAHMINSPTNASVRTLPSSLNFDALRRVDPGMESPPKRLLPLSAESTSSLFSFEPSVNKYASASPFSTVPKIPSINLQVDNLPALLERAEQEKRAEEQGKAHAKFLARQKLEEAKKQRKERERRLAKEAEERKIKRMLQGEFVREDGGIGFTGEAREHVATTGNAKAKKLDPDAVEINASVEAKKVDLTSLYKKLPRKRPQGTMAPIGDTSGSNSTRQRSPDAGLREGSISPISVDSLDSYAPTPDTERSSDDESEHKSKRGSKGSSGTNSRRRTPRKSLPKSPKPGSPPPPSVQARASLSLATRSSGTENMNARAAARAAALLETPTEPPAAHESASTVAPPAKTPRKTHAAVAAAKKLEHRASILQPHAATPPLAAAIASSDPPVEVLDAIHTAKSVGHHDPGDSDERPFLSPASSILAGVAAKAAAAAAVTAVREAAEKKNKRSSTHSTTAGETTSRTSKRLSADPALVAATSKRSSATSSTMDPLEEDELIRSVLQEHQTRDQPSNTKKEHYHRSIAASPVAEQTHVESAPSSKKAHRLSKPSDLTVPVVPQPAKRKTNPYREAVDADLEHASGVVLTARQHQQKRKSKRGSKQHTESSVDPAHSTPAPPPPVVHHVHKPSLPSVRPEAIWIKEESVGPWSAHLASPKATKEMHEFPAPLPSPAVAAPVEQQKPIMEAKQADPPPVTSPATAPPSSSFQSVAPTACSTTGEFRSLRSGLRKYGVSKLIEELLKAGWFTRSADGAISVTAADKPFNPFARLVTGKLTAPYGDLLALHGLTDSISSQFFVARNRPELDEQWASDKDEWKGKASMAKRHQFLLVRSVEWSSFNVLTLGMSEVEEDVEAKTHRLRLSIQLLNNMERTAVSYTSAAGWTAGQVGLFFHAYPLNSVQHLHLHMLDLSQTGPTYEFLKYKNLPLAAVREVLQEELGVIDSARTPATVVHTRTKPKTTLKIPLRKSIAPPSPTAVAPPDAPNLIEPEPIVPADPVVDPPLPVVEALRHPVHPQRKIFARSFDLGALQPEPAILVEDGSRTIKPQLMSEALYAANINLPKEYRVDPSTVGVTTQILMKPQLPQEPQLLQAKSSARHHHLSTGSLPIHDGGTARTTARGTTLDLPAATVASSSSSIAPGFHRQPSMSFHEMSSPRTQDTGGKVARSKNGKR